MRIKFLLIILGLIAAQSGVLGMSSDDDDIVEGGDRTARVSLEQQLFQDGYVAIDSGASSDYSTSGYSFDLPRETLIFDAIDERDHDRVFQLLDRDADCEQKNEYGQTPLIYAAQQMEADIVETLLMRGAQLAARDQWGYNALFHAAENNDIDTIRVLTEYCNRQRHRFEEQMILAVALVPHEIDDEDNPYFGEIYSMLVEPSSILPEDKQKEAMLKEVLSAQKLVKKLSAQLGIVISEQEYRCLPRKKLKRKKLRWLRTRYHRLLPIRDRLVDQSTAVSSALAAPSTSTTVVDIGEGGTCFACCETFFLSSVTLLKPIPCSQCSGRDSHVCHACLLKLRGICPFCQYAFEG